MSHPFAPDDTEVDLCTTCGYRQTDRLHGPKPRWFMTTKTPKASYILGGFWIVLATFGILIRIGDDDGPSWFQATYLAFQAFAAVFYLAAARTHTSYLREAAAAQS